MFSSFFSAAPAIDPTAATVHPVSSAFAPAALNGALDAKDLEWTCSSGFITETQTFYIVAETGENITFQIIHASLGVWYPTIQVTCKIHNPITKTTIWRSANCSGFAPDAKDRRSSRSDEFTINFQTTSDPDFPEKYVIDAKLPEDVQVHFEFARPAAIPGFKLGQGPKGGFTYFGPDVATPEGYVVHRFWPRTATTGTYTQAGKSTSISGPGMLSHAIQGMRPNLIATRWNFANFQSNEHGGVSAMQMEFTTLPAYGPNGAGSGGIQINVGSLVVGGKLVSVTAETTSPFIEQAEKAPVMSRAIDLNPQHDVDTGYDVPSAILFQWAGPSLLPEAPGELEATLHVNLGTMKEPKGLIEKVDVMAEIPYVIKMAVNVVTGTKPYIYQWTNDVKLLLKGPDAMLPGLSGGLEVAGNLYSEASWVSASAA